MDYQQGIDFVDEVIKKAVEELLVEKAWQIWVGHISNPFAEKKIPWERFINDIKKPKPIESKLTAEEIIAKAEDIKNRHLKNRDLVNELL